MSEQTTGKGRPTPKRAKQGRGPVAAPPTDRKEAARRLREKQAAARSDLKQSYARGDDALLLPRDQGPQRRLVRDVVDGRHNLATLLLPVALVTIGSGLSRNVQAQALTFGLWLAVLLAAAFDSVLLALTVRRRLQGAFPGESTRGHLFYGVMRSTSLRRIRRPKPAVPAAPFFPKRG